MAWSLANIRSKVRLLTARESANDISDDDINTYINNYYQQDFVAILDLDELEDWWEFQTTPNDEDFGDVDTNFAVLGPAYVNGDNIELLHNPEPFFEKYGQDYDIDSVGTGDGATASFSFTLTKTPVSPRHIVIDDQTETFTVSSATATTATLTGDQGGSGTVTLATGAGSVTFNTAPSDGQDIRATYEVFSTGKPIAALLFEDRITFRPIPDEVYDVRIKVASVPSSLTASVNLVWDHWGKAVAYGAAMDLAMDYGQQELAALLEVQLKKLLNNVRLRQVRQLSNSRSLPTF